MKNLEIEEIVIRVALYVLGIERMFEYEYEYEIDNNENFEIRLIRKDEEWYMPYRIFIYHSKGIVSIERRELFDADNLGEQYWCKSPDCQLDDLLEQTEQVYQTYKFVKNKFRQLLNKINELNNEVHELKKEKNFWKGVINQQSKMAKELYYIPVLSDIKSSFARKKVGVTE